MHFPGKPELLQFLLEDFLQGLGQAYASPYANLTEVDMTGLLPSTMPVFEYIEHHQDQFKALMTMHGDMAPDQQCVPRLPYSRFHFGN